MDSAQSSLDMPAIGDVDDGPAREPRRPPSLAAMAPVNTFDIFDTLIARRCIEPHRIFDMMEQRSGIAAFAEARRRAEASVAHQPYDLDAIYAALATLLTLSAEAADQLRRMEIDLELDNVMPVAEHVAAVADGDVLISDMYLGATVIRRMLERVGFSKTVGLVVTSDGKHSGRIWPQMLDKIVFGEHLGDNQHSDTLMPNRFGIKARHTTVTMPNGVEKALLDMGLLDLARLCRETRLVTWSPDPGHRALQVIQASLNVPILVLASIALVRLAQRLGRRSILFSSRDCNLWLPMFRAVATAAGYACETEYFYTSRLTRTRPSEDYLAYAAEKLHEDALVVDICGTGWSLAHLFETLGLKGRDMFFLHRLPPVALYEDRAPTPTGSVMHALLEGVERRWQNMTLEMCNYAEHSMVADVRRVSGVSFPAFAPDPRPAAIRGMVAAQRACCLKAVEVATATGLRESLTLDDTSIVGLVGALYECLSVQSPLYLLFSDQHLIEDRGVMQALCSV